MQAVGSPWTCRAVTERLAPLLGGSRLAQQDSKTQWPVCAEKAGALVRTNVRLRDLNVGVAAADGRAIEVLAQGLACRGGRQLAVDATLRSALDANGEARPLAATKDGVVAETARKDKAETYHELVSDT